MRFFIVPMLTVLLFVASDANAFVGCIARATGGMGNINSGTCGAGAKGLWDSYCSGGGHTNYSYGSGFGAYAQQIPPAPCGGCGGGCGGGAGFWYGGGHSCGSSCGSRGCGSGCSLGGCGLGAHLQGLMSRLRSRCCSAGCCSAGSSWVGGGPLDSYTVAPASGFDGGIDYGYMNTCSDGGCGGGCSGGDAGVAIHSEGAFISEPTPAAGVPVEGGAVIEGPFNHAG